jgi:hypothetical protein
MNHPEPWPWHHGMHGGVDVGIGLCSERADHWGFLGESPSDSERWPHEGDSSYCKDRYKVGNGQCYFTNTRELEDAPVALMALDDLARGRTEFEGGTRTEE